MMRFVPIHERSVPVKVIDSHAHYVPQTVFDTLARGAARFDGVECLHEDGRFRLAFADREPTRPVNPKLREADQRLAWMDEQGLDRQVVAPWTDSFGYELEGRTGADWNRFCNEALWQACEGEERLIPLAGVPLQDGERAADVLCEALDHGFRGFMIGTQPHGDSGVLDDPSLEPFWAAAHERRAVLYVHPMYVTSDPRVVDYDMVNAVGRLADTTVAVARILFSGHVLKYSGARLILSHGGAALPFALGRLVRNVEAHPGQYADPAEGLSRLYVDSCVFRPDALRFLVDLMGAERVMLGSDYPFPIGDPAPRKVVDDTPLTDAQRAEILSSSTARLLGL